MRNATAATAIKIVAAWAIVKACTNSEQHDTIEIGTVYARDTDGCAWQHKGNSMGAMVTCNDETPTLKALTDKIRAARYINPTHWVRLDNGDADLPDWALVPQTVRQPRKCPRCDGRGGIDIYRHVQNGICFRCHGTGKF